MAISSIRSKLTWAYSWALLATLLIFSAAILLARRATTTREMTTTASVYADLAMGILREASNAQENLIVRPTPEPELAPKYQNRLGLIPGYLVVLDSDGRRVYQSPLVGTMSPTEDSSFADAATSLSESSSATVTLAAEDVTLVKRRDPDPRYSVFTVVAGVGSAAFDAALRELFASLFLVLPLVIGFSIFSAYSISRRAVEPIERIRTEVEAITDGRSLHRRLAVEAGGEELDRLTLTLNDMIGRLETSFGALRRFTADASHELKTPLAVLRADVERAMHATPQGNEQLVALEEALVETTRMADLVESLLTLARADEGRFDLHREVVDLEPLARDVFETANILGEDAELTVRMPEVQPVTVLGDRIRLRQLFLNLVTNAIKYTPRHGEVELQLTHDDAHAIFSVRDTGVGIAAADLPYVFERFWRADRARSRSAERSGFGLGLAIAQWIAQAHGGTLTAQSRLHRGSTFTVTLPLAPGAIEPRADEDATSSALTTRATV